MWHSVCGRLLQQQSDTDTRTDFVPGPGGQQRTRWTSPCAGGGRPLGSGDRYLVGLMLSTVKTAKQARSRGHDLSRQLAEVSLSSSL